MIIAPRKPVPSDRTHTPVPRVCHHPGLPQHPRRASGRLFNFRMFDHQVMGKSVGPLCVIHAGVADAREHMMRLAAEIQNPVGEAYGILSRFRGKLMAIR